MNVSFCFSHSYGELTVVEGVLSARRGTKTIHQLRTQTVFRRGCYTIISSQADSLSKRLLTPNGPCALPKSWKLPKSFNSFKCSLVLPWASTEHLTEEHKSFLLMCHHRNKCLLVGVLVFKKTSQVHFFFSSQDYESSKATETYPTSE